MSAITRAPVNASEPSEFDVVVLPGDDERQRRVSVVLVGSVALSFISFWRAAAIVLNDMASTVYYIGGIGEQAIGKAAPWFVLAVMLFAYAVRAVYVESCTMFTRGGVYRVVKEAMGGPLAKLSVSALMFDYVLTGPISAVSAGQYLVGMAGNLVALTPLHWQLNADVHRQIVKLLSMLIAVGITVYFWRLNLIGIRESSGKAVRIMQLTTVMGVIVIGWALATVALRPETRHLPPIAPVLTLESQGWLSGLPRIVGMIGILIAFGHTLLAMSGEESLAQVYREIEAPKLPNLLKAGAVIALYSLVLTGVVTFLAIMIIPDAERITTTIDPTTGAIVRGSAKYTDNLISGLVMHLAGPSPLRLALQAFVVFVGFLILSGAVNTSIVGSNGVLNRLAEDGILTPWFLHPQPRFGTTHRLINIVCVLQLVTIVASMGDVYTLGEAYAFGVIWSFVFKTLAMVVLRFKDKSPREYEVPLNVRIQTGSRSSGAAQRVDLPIGIGVIFLVLLSTAVVNLFTKKVATVWGISFTAGFLLVIILCEQISRRLRGGGHHEHLEQFNERVVEQATPHALTLTHPDPVVVAIRNPRSMGVLDAVLRETDTARRDVVAVTCKVLPPLTPGITREELTVDRIDREVLTRVVNLAEEAGKQVHPVVIPTNNPLYAIATVARDLAATEVVLGTSAKSSTDRLLEQFAIAWGLAGGGDVNGRPLAIRVVGKDEDVRFEL